MCASDAFVHWCRTLTTEPLRTAKPRMNALTNSSLFTVVKDGLVGMFFFT